MKKGATKQIAVTPLIDSENVTASGNGTAKDLSGSLPQTVMAVLSVRCAGADSNETLTVAVQGSNDGSTFTTIDTFEQVLQPAGRSFQRMDIGQPVYRQYRAVKTVGGTTPDFEVSCVLIGANPTYAPVTQVD